MVMRMEDKIICSDCGAELDADVSICPECGNPIKRQRKRSSGSLKPSKNFYAVILILLYSLSLIINLAKGVGINTIIQGIGIVALIVNVYFKKDSISDTFNSLKTGLLSDFNEAHPENMKLISVSFLELNSGNIISSKELLEHRL